MFVKPAQEAVLIIVTETTLLYAPPPGLTSSCELPDTFKIVISIMDKDAI